MELFGTRDFASGSASEILTRDDNHLIPVYDRFPVVIDRGEGCWLVDGDGRRYLDMMGGLGVNALGHAHQRMVAAMVDQAGKIIHLSPKYSNPWPSLLAERLCILSGMTGVFFSTGGSEAVEGALKLARTHGRQVGGHQKHGIVALRGSYHGRTFGSLSVTGQDKYSVDFGPGLPGVKFIQRNDITGLRAAVSNQTCAILIEPVLGEGGVQVCSNEFLQAARELADATGALLIFDEIQCGLGRVGRWFAYEPSGVAPDILILGKPLGGGLPLSALLVTEALFHSFGMAKHGSTLGGSPMACRLGMEFLSVMEDENILAHVRSTGAHLRRHLDRLASKFEEIREVRGEGLMCALELTVPARPIVEDALHLGVMLNSVQDTMLRFLPPLIVTEAQVDHAMDVLETVLTKRLTRRKLHGLSTSNHTPQAQVASVA
jgi:acetylornithine/N-succinyldiaminopimelate aminotransferase